MHRTIHIEINGKPHKVHRETRTGAEIKAIAGEKHGILFCISGELPHRIADDVVVQFGEHAHFKIANEEHATTPRPGRRRVRKTG